MSGEFKLYKYKINDIVTTKKPHPCGGNEWIVERVGQDIGIKCIKCKHFLIISRRKLEKATKSINSSDNMI